MSGRIRHVATLLSTVVILTGCTVTLGGQRPPVTPVWDLRQTRDVSAVGFPTDTTLYQVDEGQGLERVLLPDGIEVEAPFRVGVIRDTGAEVLRAMTITFPREEVGAVLARAERWAELTGVDVRPLRDWAERNAKGIDNSPGGSSALTGSVSLADGGPTFALTTRTFLPGDALLRIELFWPDGTG